MEFSNTQEPPIKADFDRVMLELKQQRDEALEQRNEMKRVLDELVASRAEVDRLKMASKQTPERAQVDVYQHVLKEMMSTKEEAKRERDSAKEEAKRERDRFEERLDKLQELHRENARDQLQQAKEREDARERELRLNKEEARQREEAMFSREEARRKEAKEEARALREEVIERMEKAQKKEIEILRCEMLLVKREVRSPKGHTERNDAPHNDSEHNFELIPNNEHNSELPNTKESKVRLDLKLPLYGDDVDDDNVEQISNIEYLDNDSDNESYEEHHIFTQGQGEEESVLPSTSIITRPTPAPSADDIDAWSPAEVVRVVQEVIEKWKSLAEEVYGKRSNSSVQNLHHIRSVITENEMAFKPVLNICPNLPIIIAHMMVIHVGISVRTVSWTSKMTEWTEEVSQVICVAHIAYFLATSPRALYRIVGELGGPWRPFCECFKLGKPLWRHGGSTTRS